jgi:hypothetical protein
VDANINKTMRDMHVRLMYATAEKNIIRFETKHPHPAASECSPSTPSNPPAKGRNKYGPEASYRYGHRQLAPAHQYRSLSH